MECRIDQKKGLRQNTALSHYVSSLLAVWQPERGFNERELAVNGTSDLSG